MKIKLFSICSSMIRPVSRSKPARSAVAWLVLLFPAMTVINPGVAAAQPPVISEFTVPTAGRDPWWVAAGPDGNVWFTEFHSGNIGRITASGTITEFAVPTANSAPFGIAAGPDGNLWFTEFIGN